MADASWTEEEIKLIVELWQSGHSASQISFRLKNKRSRNSVISKIHRLGMSGRGGNPTRAKKAPVLPKKQKLEAHPWKKDPALSQVKIVARLMAEPIPVANENDIVRVKNLVDLEPHHCKWPIGALGDPGFGFCGDTKVSGLPYCACHSVRAFHPAQSARSRQAAVEVAKEKQKAEV